MLEKQTKQPIHNRQQPRLLQAFPNFDKCDSLLYFAHTLTRHFNCGDYPGVHKLMSSHLDKTYRISMNHCCFEEGFSCRNFVRLFELMGDLQPDRIMCVHTTKVDKNQIKSTIFMKFKDVKFLYDSIVPRIQDPHFQAMWGGKKRSDAFQRKIQADGRPAEEVDYLMKLVDTDLDLTVNVRLELILTFDPLTKKVTDMEFKGKMLSMVPLESHR